MPLLKLPEPGSRVADEVRTLAQRTAEATHEISALISTIGGEVERVSSGIESVGERGDRLAGEVSNISRKIGSISEVGNKVTGSFHFAASLSFLETVKLDHVVWKSQVYQCVRADDTEACATLADHTGCRLGKWYSEGIGYQNYRHLPSYARLEEPHRNVHKYGFNAIEARKNAEYPRMLGYLEQMENASDRVIQVLCALEEEIRSA